jgi:outer membrane protein TolC
MAVEKNLDVKAELYNPAQAEADIRKNRAIYETHLTLNTSYQDSTTFPANTISSGGGVSSYEQQTLRLSPGVYRLIPTGGTLGLTFNNYYTSTNTKSAFAMKDYWQSDLTLSFSQPLLKNFGRESTELNIQASVFAKDGSLQRFKGKLLTTVAQVRSEYFKLQSFRDDLESKKISLELAKRVLSETEKRVSAGVLPAMEILNAQFGVASREKDVIDAEKSVRDEVDVIRVLLQINDVRDIIPTDIPTRDQFTMNEEAAVKKALAERPELEELKSQIASGELQTRVAKSRTQPDLTFTSSAAVTGLGQSYSRNMERAGSTDYPVWSVGLQLDYPLGNQSAENDYIKSRLNTDQARTQLESLQSSISAETRTALRTVETSYKQLEVTDRGRAYAEERLKAYMKRNEVGLGTTKDVLDVENDLATARSNQIKAQVGYTTAISQLWKATGELLQREGITVTTTAADELYGKAR